MTAKHWIAVILTVALGGCSSFPAATARDAAVDTSVDVPMADTGVDAPAVDTGVDVLPPIDTGVDVLPPIDTGVDAPVVDTGVDVPPPPVDMGVDVSVVDTGVDVPPPLVDMGVDVPMPDVACPSGQTRCGSACVNTATDPANCGVCGHVCGTGQVCNAGTCGCPTGMVLIPGGTFTMGAAVLMDATPHRVTLSPYCMDMTEVTVAAFGMCPASTCGTASTPGSVCNGEVPGRELHPINCVTWSQAHAYCQWVHGVGGDLPTEAQWEFAARNGAMDWDYPWGAETPYDQLCWSGGSYGVRSSTCQVMMFTTPANAFGLFDMEGNVWEWTRDCYADYSVGAAAVVDPSGPMGGCTNHVYRGSGWGGTTRNNVLGAFRDGTEPTYVGGFLGFRCARGL